MAALGREGQENIVDQKIYDNNSKEINPQMVRDALKVIIESNFNLVDDLLRGARYDENRTLGQALPTVLWGSTGVFDIGDSTGTIPGSSGIISNATISTLGQRSDSELSITFNQNLSDRKLSVAIFTNSANMNENNDVGSPVIRVVSGTNIRVGLKEVSGDTQQIRLEILAFKIEN